MCTTSQRFNKFAKSSLFARANCALPQRTLYRPTANNNNRLSESDALERVRASFKSCSIDDGGDDDDGKALNCIHVCAYMRIVLLQAQPILW